MDTYAEHVLGTKAASAVGKDSDPIPRFVSMVGWMDDIGYVLVEVGSWRHLA